MPKEVTTWIMFEILLTFVYAGEANTEVAKPIQAEDTLALLVSQVGNNVAAGNGFIIGDGTLLVTNQHQVDEFYGIGKVQTDSFVMVLSPYLGEACNVEIICADAELDLAVLRVPWRGHPALSLADDQMVLSAEQIEFIGMLPLLSELGSLTKESVGKSLGMQYEKLPVDFVAARNSVPQFVSLMGAGKVGHGWSGCPMLLPDKLVAAGTFMGFRFNVIGKSKELKGAEGPTSAQIRYLIRKAGLKSSVNPPAVFSARPNDALDAFVLFVRAFWNSMGFEYRQGLADAQKLISLRPKSSLAHRIAARAAARENKCHLAEDFDRKAANLDPNGMNVRVLDSECLMRVENKEKILEQTDKQELPEVRIKHFKEPIHYKRSSPEALQIEDALVLVVSYFGLKVAFGSGALVGDGTLVVTVDSVVYNYTIPGERLDSFVMVFSPYLGEACDAEIICADAELDLAVLRVPWRGHPTLSLADEQAIVSAKELDVMGIEFKQSDIAALGSVTKDTIGEFLGLGCRLLPVAYVGVRNHKPRFIMLQSREEVLHWFGNRGSPMLLPSTSITAGFFSVAMLGDPTKRSKPKGAYGSVAAHVKPMVKKAGLDNCLQAHAQTLVRPQDALDAFVLFLRAFLNMRGRHHRQGLADAKKLISLRPTNALAYRLSAQAAELRDKHDLAETFYKKAECLDPNGTNARVLHAKHLAERGEPKKALDLLDLLWKRGKSKPIVAINLDDILERRDEYERCGAALKEALAVNPRNAELWLRLGRCQYKLGKHDAACVSWGKAIELRPDHRTISWP